MSRHADEMDAVAFWRGVDTTFYFDTPGATVAGLLVDYTDRPILCLTIQTKDGDRYTVPATQERLKAALKAQRPAKGDRIRITFDGLAEKAAPGMNKAKLFTVEVRRQGSQPPGSSGSGEVPGENTPEVEK